MATLEMLAQAVLERDGLRVRSVAQDFLHETVVWQSVPRPATLDKRLLVIAASVLELLALRQSQTPPAWVHEVGSLDEPFFVIRAAEKMQHLRQLCLAESPEPLKKRGLYAPPNFLAFA